METKELCTVYNFCQKQYSLLEQHRKALDKLYASIGGDPSVFDSRLETIGKAAIKEQRLNFWEKPERNMADILAGL